MKEIVERGATAQVVHVFLPDAASAVGGGKVGLSAASAGLVVAVIRPGEASATVYRQADGTIEGVSVLGTYQPPTAGRVRLREVDATALPGWYELQLANALFDGSGGRRSLGGMVHGASGVVPTPFQIQLSDPLRGVGSPGYVDAAVTSRSALTAAQVRTEVAGALSADLYGEPTGVPGGVSSLKDKLGWLFAMSRNRRQTTATADVVRNDADTAAIGAAALSDDGVMFTRGEYA